MQKTFVIKPENKLESVAEEEKRIDTKQEAISISEEEDVVIKAGIIEEVKGEDVITEAEAIEEVKGEDVITEAEAIEEVKREAEIAEAEVIEEVKEEAEIAEAEVIEEVKREAEIAEAEVIEEVKEEDVIAEAEVIEEVKREDVVAEAEVIEEVKREDVVAEAEVIEEVKEQVEFTKEQQTDGEQLKGEQPETRVMAAKENKLFSNPIVAEKKNEEAGLSKGVQKRKSFKDMNNEEKLYFLIHKPKYIPKVRCQIKTVKGNLTGYVLSYEEGYVIIKLMEKTKEIKVKFEDIVHIKMMGL